MHQKQIANNIADLGAPAAHVKTTHKGKTVTMVPVRYEPYVPRTERQLGGITQRPALVEGKEVMIPMRRKAVKCPECGRPFMTLEGMNSHYNHYHLGGLYL